MTKEKTKITNTPDCATTDPEDKIESTDHTSNMGPIAFAVVFFLIVLAFANLGPAIANTIGESLGHVSDQVADGLAAHYR